MPTPGTVTAADGTELRLWEQVPDGEVTEEAVLFVHGSITCSRALFAPPVGEAPRASDGASGRDPRAGEDYSWLAAADRAAFALDVRGYGDSERPPELDEPPEANAPAVRAPTAAEDVDAAFRAVRERYDTVHLVGVSWGTMTCGYFCTEYDHDAASLAQVAPVYQPPWSFAEIAAALNVSADLDAYYHQCYDEVKERQGGDEALFEAIWRTQVESNQGVDEETYLVPSGALADSRDAAEGERVYDAAALDLPTLVVRGSADAVSTREDALTLYDGLDVPDDEAEYQELAGGDHYVMHGHRRHDLYRAVSDFQGRV